MKFPLFLTIALLGGIGAFAQQGPLPVTVAKPVVNTIVEDDEFVGRFEASADVQIRVRVTGYLNEVHFTNGQLVAAGDLLFSLERRQFETAMRQAEAQNGGARRPTSASGWSARTSPI